MRHNDILKLIKTDTTYDELGNPIKTKTPRTVFVNKMSVGLKEFYEASAKGMKPEQQFALHAFEYDGEKLVEYKGVTYKVTRVSEKGERVQIVCERVIGDG